MVLWFQRMRDPCTCNDYHDHCQELYNNDATITHREAHCLVESNAFDAIRQSAPDDFRDETSLYFLITFPNLSGHEYYGEVAPDVENELKLNAVGKIPKGKTDPVYTVNWKCHIKEEKPRFGKRIQKPTKAKKWYTAEVSKGMNQPNTGGY